MMSQCDSDSAAMMSQCDSDSAAMMSQCDTDSAGDDVTVWHRFRWRWCHSATQIPLRWCHSATQIPLAMMSQCDSDSAAMMSQCDSDSAGDDVTVRLRFRCDDVTVRLRFRCDDVTVRLRFRCDDVTVRLRFRWRWCHKCDSDSAGDDVTVRLRFRWRWCQCDSDSAAMMSQCDSDSAAMMSCSDLDSGSSSGTVYIFRLLFLPLHSADEIHSASLSLSLSVCLSLSRLCFAVCVYHGFTVSHFQIRTNTITHSTHGRQSKAPCSERSNKTGAQTALSWVMRLHTHTNSQKQCLLFTHTLTCDSLIKSDQIHLPFRKAVRVFPRVRAEIRTSQDNRHKTQQITEHVPVQISHIFYLFKGLMVSEQ